MVIEIVKKKYICYDVQTPLVTHAHCKSTFFSPTILFPFEVRVQNNQKICKNIPVLHLINVLLAEAMIFDYKKKIKIVVRVHYKTDNIYLSSYEDGWVFCSYKAI